eukprot:Amastigsp_a184658_11.p4 type:complete len:110 gc:universal Amastigsp_a184658_11:792-463(-)
MGVRVFRRLAGDLCAHGRRRAAPRVGARGHVSQSCAADSASREPRRGTCRVLCSRADGARQRVARLCRRSSCSRARAATAALPPGAGTPARPHRVLLRDFREEEAFRSV